MPPGTNLAVQALRKTTNGATLAECRRIVTPEMIAQCLKEALGAMAYDREGNESGPNWTARIAACTILLNYYEGRPVERQEIVTQDVTETDESRMERLMRSRAARDQFRRLLDQADMGAEAKSA